MKCEKEKKEKEGEEEEEDSCTYFEMFSENNPISGVKQRGRDLWRDRYFCGPQKQRPWRV